MTASSVPILRTRIGITSYADAAERVLAWGERRESRYVCVAPVSSIMEAHDSPEFRRIMNEADLVTPDGMPLVWGLRLLGCRDASRVYGPDLTPIILQRAADRGLSVGFYGGSEQTLDRLLSVVRKRFPLLNIGWTCSPPFRTVTAEEDRATVDEINQSGLSVLFVGLGSPKQERWMAAHKGQIHAVMIGVGAAFDFMAGTKSQAPRWMMRMGMEWSFRLITEPRRLWKRYLKQNPRFVILFALQLLGMRKFSAT